MKHKRTKKKSRKPDHTVQRSQSHSDWLWPLVVLIILALAAGLWWAHKRKQGEMASVVDKVRIETNKGTIVLGVYSDNVPLTAKNFVDLVSSGFYDGLIWHRVEDWVVQTGDPEGTGRGGSDKTIKLEVDPDLKNTRGMVGMARKDDPDSATSQFYILKSDAPWLDESYAVFAKVMEGMDVVEVLRLAIG